MTIDGFGYVKTLTDAGIPQAQAEAHMAALRTTVLPALMTRNDFKLLTGELRLEMAELRVDLRSSLAGIRGDIWKMFGIMVLASAVIVAIVARSLS